MTALERIGQCPAASVYGDLMRARRSGIDPYAREAARVRTLMAACRAPVVAPSDATERDVRRAQMQGFRL